MDQKKLSELQADAAELRKLMDLAERSRVKDALSIELRKVETQLIKEKEKEEAAATPRPKVTPATNGPKEAYDVQVKNFSWDQSEKFVKIYMTGLTNAQKLPEEDVVKTFSPFSVEVRVQNLDGKNHVFNIKETSEKIVPEKSYVKVKTDMVVIFLHKHSEGTKWKHLKAVEKAADKMTPKIDKNEDPSASLMNMMKQMYEEGDDEMKKTIAKAWTESRNKENPLDSL